MPDQHARTDVTVVITTYNERQFIREAIDGVLAQETTFPFEIVVIDDCSTDGTQEILAGYQRAHPGKIRLVLLETNRCDNVAFMKALEEAPSRYVAILDGDDYWIRTDKLQRQVDYLDAHPEASFCFHKVRLIQDDGSFLPITQPAEDQTELTLTALLESCFIATCSVVLRQSAVRSLPDWYARDDSADWSLFILAAQQGSIGYVDEIMAVYRRHAGGLWSRLDHLAQLERVAQFYETLPSRVTAELEERARVLLANQCYELALEHRRRGDSSAAVRWARRCVATNVDLRRMRWKLRVAGGSAAELVLPPGPADLVRIEIARASSTPFDVQLNWPHLAIQAGQRYSVRFRARAEVPRTVNVGFSLAHEPWSGLGLYHAVDLTPEWKMYDQPFTATAADPDGRIHFDLGSVPIAVEIADVVLVHESGARASDPDLLTSVNE